MLVLYLAAFDIAQWKEYVSSQMMDASQFRRHGMPLGQALRLIEQPQGFIKTFADAKAFSEPDLCAAQRFVARRRR